MHSLTPFGLLHSSTQFSVSVTWQTTTHHRAGTAQARSCSEIEKRTLPPLCFPGPSFQRHPITESYARASVTHSIHAHVGLTVHWAELDTPLPQWVIEPDRPVTQSIATSLSGEPNVYPDNGEGRHTPTPLGCGDAIRGPSAISPALYVVFNVPPDPCRPTAACYCQDFGEPIPLSLTVDNNNYQFTQRL